MIMISANVLAFGGGGHGRTSSQYKKGVSSLGVYYGGDGQVDVDIRDCNDKTETLIGTECCVNDRIYVEGDEKKCCDDTKEYTRYVVEGNCVRVCPEGSVAEGEKCVCAEGYEDDGEGGCVSESESSCSADNLSSCDETACNALMDGWTSGPQYQWYNDRCIEHMTTCEGEYGYTQSECEEIQDAYYWSSSAGKCYFVEGSECESLSCGREACEDKPADLGFTGSCRWDEENEVCVSAVAQCDFDHLDQCTEEECNNLGDTVWRGGVCTRYGSNDIVEDWDQEKCQEAQAEDPTYTFWSYAHEKCFDANYFQNEYDCYLVSANESVAYCCDRAYSYYNLAFDTSVPSDVCCAQSPWPYYAQDSYGVAFCYEDYSYTEPFSEGATLRACMAAHGDTEGSRYSWLNTGWDQEDGGSYCCFNNALSSQTGEPDQECCEALADMGAHWENGVCCMSDSGYELNGEPRSECQ